MHFGVCVDVAIGRAPRDRHPAVAVAHGTPCSVRKSTADGEFLDFPPMMTWPKPVQKPYPPIIMGVARVVTTLPPEPADKTLPVLDRWAELIRRVNG